MATPALLRRVLRAAGFPAMLACAGLAIAAPASDAGTVRVLPHAAPALGLRPLHAIPVSHGLTPAAQGGGKLQYNGGPVMHGTIRAVAILWEPATLQDGSPGTVDASYNTLLKRYFADAGSHGLLASSSEYYDTTNGPRRYATNAMSLARTVVDTTTPYPVSACISSDLPAQPLQNCLSDGQIQDEISSVMTRTGEVGGMNTIYFLFTDENEFSCYASNACFLYGSGGFCAYHSAFTVNSQPVLYANMPYGATPAPNGCTGVSTFPNDPDSDIEISTTSHELEETITDPLGTAWFDNQGFEIADKCAYTYGPRVFDGGKANEFWNGHFYTAQQEFSNVANSCVRGGSLTLSTRKPSRGGSLTLHGYNFSNAQTMTVKLQGANGTTTVLGTAKTSSTGQFTAKVKIPATTAKGTAHVLVTGPRAYDSDREAVTVVA
jgi:hypothetical protein